MGVSLIVNILSVRKCMRRWVSVPPHTEQARSRPTGDAAAKMFICSSLIWIIWISGRAPRVNYATRVSHRGKGREGGLQGRYTVFLICEQGRTVLAQRCPSVFFCFYTFIYVSIMRIKILLFFFLLSLIPEIYFVYINLFFRSE